MNEANNNEATKMNKTFTVYFNFFSTLDNKEVESSSSSLTLYGARLIAKDCKKKGYSRIRIKDQDGEGYSTR